MNKNDTYSIEEALTRLSKDIQELVKDMTNQGKDAANIFAPLVVDLVKRRAAAKLNGKGSLFNIYVENLGYLKVPESDNTFVHFVQLYNGAQFIEEDQPRRNILEQLINGPKSKIKKGKDGKEIKDAQGNIQRYNIIPFRHNKSDKTTSDRKKEIANIVAKELKMRGLDKVITRDGKVVISPKPPADPIAAARINLSDKSHPVSRFNKPLLTGLTIYQHVMENEKGQPIIDPRSGKPKIRRDIMTFRTASSSQKGSGLWDVPATEGIEIFDSITIKDLDELWGDVLSKIGSGITK